MRLRPSDNPVLNPKPGMYQHTSPGEAADCLCISASGVNEFYIAARSNAHTQLTFSMARSITLRIAFLREVIACICSQQVA